MRFSSLCTTPRVLSRAASGRHLALCLSLSSRNSLTSLLERSPLTKSMSSKEDLVSISRSSTFAATFATSSILLKDATRLDFLMLPCCGCVIVSSSICCVLYQPTPLQRRHWLTSTRLFHSDHVTDASKWDGVSERLIKTINEKCTTPSDCKTLFNPGCGSPLTLFFSGGSDAVCFEATPAGYKMEDLQKDVDEWTNGSAINTLYPINDGESLNVMNLSLDHWCQDAFAWAKQSQEVTTKAVHATVTSETIPIASQ